MTKYIAYVDLLGVKELARYDANEFKKAMDAFRKYLVLASKAFHKSNVATNSIFPFSDSALIESDDLKILLKLLTIFRDDLFCEGYYFTAAVDNGELKSSVYSKYIQESSDHVDYQESINYFHGSTFHSKDVSTLYNQFSHFKGIGIYISDGITQSRKIPVRTVPSHYLSSFETGRIRTYTDIAFDKKKITKDFIHRLMFKYTLSNAKSTKFGIYYISLICSIIHSLDFKKIDIPQANTQPTRITDHIKSEMTGDLTVKDTLVFILTIKDNYKELFAKAKSIEIIYLSLIEKIYKDRKKPDLTTKSILKAIIEIPRIKNYFGLFNTIPESVISQQSYNLMMQDYLRIIEERITPKNPSTSSSTK